MPELPEVETVRRGLEPAMTGATIDRVETRRANLRFAFPQDFAARLEGCRIAALGRRAKYLLADLDSGDVLFMHLGMSGSFRIEDEGRALLPGEFRHERSTLPAHDHVVFHLSTGARIVYNDPRRFGFMDIASRSMLDAHPLFAGIGIEPLGNALDGAFLANAFGGRKTPLKAALLDQRIIAGLGNIYVCEALHRSGLSPRRRAGTLARKAAKGGFAPTARAELLAANIRQVLEDAIAAGGSSLRDHRLTDGTLGYFQHNFAVYDREGEPCRTPGCLGTVRRIVQSGRSTFFCSSCQR